MELGKLLTFVGKSVKDQVSGAAGGKTVEGYVGNVISAIFGIGGVIAVVVIIIGGVFYATAQGDPGKVTKGKNCIIGGIIGLIICIAAIAIVNFVMKGISGQI